MTVGFQNSAGVDLDNIFAVTNSNDGALGFVTNDNQDIGNRYPLGSVGFEVGYKDSTGTDIGFLRAKSFAITYSNDGNGTYGFSQNADGTWQITNTFVNTFTKRADNVIDFYCDEEQTWFVNKNHELFGCGNNDFYR